MTSSDLEGFGNWERWPAAIDKAPGSPGVYVFRLAAAKAFPRIKGESDIVYIGTTEDGQGTVRRRLIDHRNCCSDERYWLHRIETEIGQLEIAWRSFAEHSDAQWIESNLLATYVQDHIDSTPGNRQQSLALVQDALHLLKIKSPKDKQLFKNMLDKRTAGS